jgi:hypothetical protein
VFLTFSDNDPGGLVMVMCVPKLSVKSVSHPCALTEQVTTPHSLLDNPLINKSALKLKNPLVLLSISFTVVGVEASYAIYSVQVFFTLYVVK